MPPREVTVDDETTDELASKVLSARRAGASFDQIAERLNLTPKAAKALFDKAIGSYDPEYTRALEADRLDRLHLAVWPDAVQGDLNAVDRVLRISERRDKVLAVPKENDHALREAFDRSAATSTQLQDAGLLEAGRKIADRVDEAVATGEGQEVTKALYLLPHMVNVLREMLATPASRNAVKQAAPKDEGGKLAQLRAIHNTAKKTG
jgi:hypothetical protein